MHNLTLYHFEGCPYCAIVRSYLQKKDIQIPLKDIDADPKNREELIKIGGKSQVPCLVVDGKALYESMDIIEWFEKNSKEK